MAEHARAFSIQDVLRMMKAFNAAAVDTRGGWQPSLSLELAVAEVLESPTKAPSSEQSERPQRSKSEPSLVQPSKPEKKPAASVEPKSQPEAPAKTPKKEEPVEKKAPKAETGPRSAMSVVEPQKAGTAAISLAEVAKAWRDIRSVVKPDHPSVEALLNSCRPLDVRGNELYLGFQSHKVRELFDIPERVTIARKAIAEVLGVELAIKCVVTNARGQLPPDVNPDGMVAAAIRNGGEIVDVQD
jgi:DNA polymerase III gamma/tau subunit